MASHSGVQKRSLKGDFNGEGVLYHKFFLALSKCISSAGGRGATDNPTPVECTEARTSEVNGLKLHCVV